MKTHKFLVCAYNSQDIEQTQENFARSHDRETVTLRNFAKTHPVITIPWVALPFLRRSANNSLIN